MSVTAIILPPAPELLAKLHPGGNLNNFILPHVILWDPLNQFPGLFAGGVLCSSCSKQLKEIVRWKWGQSLGLQPRVIHGLETTILIVPAVYSCVNEHTIVATDPRILKLLNSDLLPFVLLHRTGFSKQFVSAIIHLLCEGMTISRVEQYITKTRKEYVANLYLRLKHILPDDSSLTPTSSPLTLIETPAPSDDVLSKCFLAHFFRKQDDI